MNPTNEKTISAARQLDSRVCATILTVLAALMCVILRGMGRVWWCEAGDWSPWSWDVWSTHNSQHLADPYALSHIEHGIGLSVLLAAIFGNKVSLQIRTIIIAMIETTWEIVENTPWMINRYREATISLDYLATAF